MAPPLYSSSRGSYQFLEETETESPIPERAQIMLQLLANQLRQRDAQSHVHSSSSTHDLCSRFEELRGSWLLPRLRQCGIFSMADLTRIAWYCEHRPLSHVLRLALGLAISGRNWNVLRRLLYHCIEPRELFSDPDAAVCIAYKRQSQIARTAGALFMLSCCDFALDQGYTALLHSASDDVGCSWLSQSEMDFTQLFPNQGRAQKSDIEAILWDLASMLL
ncbi:hypothetical protein BDZ89DRAFT_1127581 [Hymenopellis radicata]|nr:hypothetical protein BDZ89DRAFT_1127581 [Hymenopellis radicata]